MSEDFDDYVVESFVVWAEDNGFDPSRSDLFAAFAAGYEEGVCDEDAVRTRSPGVSG